MHITSSAGVTRAAVVFATPFAYTVDGLPLFLEAGPARGYPSSMSSMAPGAVSSPINLGVSNPLVAKRRKKRLVWSPELHARFEAAVLALGVDIAGPKQIMAAMGVPELTRENVSSHLQKYRDGIRRMRERELLGATRNAYTPKTLPPPTPSPRDITQGFVFPRPQVEQALPVPSSPLVRLPPIRLSPPSEDVSEKATAIVRCLRRSW